MEAALNVRVEKLEVKTGDVLCVYFPERVDTKTAEDVCSHLINRLDRNVTVIACYDEFKVEHLAPEELRKMGLYYGSARKEAFDAGFYAGRCSNSVSELEERRSVWQELSEVVVPSGLIN